MIYLKEVPAREDDSRKHEEKGCDARTEGRYIMIARKRAGMKIDELAKKLYICGETLKTWESGRKKKLRRAKTRRSPVHERLYRQAWPNRLEPRL